MFFFVKAHGEMPNDLFIESIHPLELIQHLSFGAEMEEVVVPVPLLLNRVC
jgi:hypothetical protein